MPPAALGRVLGLDRAPEVKTIHPELGELAAAGKAAELVMALARQRDILHALKIDAPPRIYQLKPPWSPDGTDSAA